MAAASKAQLLGSAFVGGAIGFALCRYLGQRRARARVASNPLEDDAARIAAVSSSAKPAETSAAATKQATLTLRVPAAQIAPDVFDAPGVEMRLPRKAETVLARRTDALLLVLECLQDGHNHCAVLRTAEALGIQHIWLVAPPPMESKNNLRRKDLAALAEESKRCRVKRWAKERADNVWEADAKADEQHTAFAKGAQRWLTVREFATTEECIEALAAEGREVWATALEQRAEVLAPSAPWLQHDARALPRRLAVVFGAEGAGVSDIFKAAAHRLVYLPLCGFAESLNVSVATALVTQLLLQLYAQVYSDDELQLSSEEKRLLRADWYARLARTEDEREEYEALLENPPEPLDDLRRPDMHRRGRKK